MWMDESGQNKAGFRIIPLLGTVCAKHIKFTLDVMCSHLQFHLLIQSILDCLVVGYFSSRLSFSEGLHKNIAIMLYRIANT
uniref:Uncharacterized protein n=1 Tax=Rhizophora mucronata TaxID=61149 RepID=A0A2P2NII1_RHIMU